MLNYIDLKLDFSKRNEQINGLTLKHLIIRDYDTALRFRIELVGYELDETYEAKILTKHRKSGLKVISPSLLIEDGKLIFAPNVNLITSSDQVSNFLYLSKDGLGLDMAQFNYRVDVSQIGEITLEVRQVYDQSYEALITEFEQALTDYKDTLPQADSVRAEIDEILNQFGVDSQAKLNQYDTDAQQVIADNQTAFNLAETGRQDSYVQAEDIRNQASNQAVVDWEQGADALVDSKLIEMQTDASTLINGAIDDFNQRGDAEIADWRVENSGALTAMETEIAKKANKEQEDWITPTLLNGWYAIRPLEPPQYMKDEFGFVHFRGAISKGASSTSNVAFNVPIGYRPNASTSFSISEIALSSKTIAVSIFENGYVDFAGGTPTNWYAISSITFKAV